jgi:hypothetical protein
VSHDYHFREWTPDSCWSFDVPEKREMIGFSSTNIYLWIVPAHVAGRWRLQFAGDKPPPLTLSFNQLFQQLSGVAQHASSTAEISGLRLRGDEIEFTLELPAAVAGAPNFRGKVAGDAMEGEVAWGSGPIAKRAKWRAERIEAAGEALAR